MMPPCAAHCCNEFDLEIGAGLGALAGKTWRIGLMGYASNERNVVYCLNALEAMLCRQGARSMPEGRSCGQGRCLTRRLSSGS